MRRFFWEMTLRMVSVFGSTIHVLASLRGVFGKKNTRFLREGGPRVGSARRSGWSEEGEFSCIFRHFSPSVRLDVSTHFSALDDEEFFVVEGSGWRGRRESDSQVFCHPCAASLTGMDKHSRQVICPHNLPPPPLPSPLPPSREPDFCGLFGRPGMMDKIGFGNLIYSVDAKGKKKNKRKTRKNNEIYNYNYSSNLCLIIIIIIINVILSIINYHQNNDRKTKEKHKKRNTKNNYNFY